MFLPYAIQRIFFLRAAGSRFYDEMTIPSIAPYGVYYAPAGLKIAYPLSLSIGGAAFSFR